MFLRLTNFLHSRKGRDAALIALIILTGTASFGLGRLSALHENRPEVAIVYPDGTRIGKKDASNTSQKETGSNLAAAAAHEAASGQVVASKTGAVYHLPWCSGAQRIKEENKIFFDSAAEAQSAGLRPAANCPGLE